VVVAYVSPASKLGGGNRVLIDLVEGLDRSQYAPLLVVPEPGPLVEWAVEANVPHRIVPGTDYAGKTATARRAARMTPIFARRRVRIVHAMSETCYRGAAISATLIGAARIVHFGYPPDLPNLRASLPFGPDALIGCYDRQAHDLGALVRRFRPACRILGIPNGIDVQRFTVGPVESSPIRAHARGASQIVLTVGHLSEIKGHVAFLRAAALLSASHPGCRFWLLGDETTDKGARKRLESLARDAGILDRVEFLGWRSDVPDVLRAADVVAMPSLNEGLPLALLEAMACGRPVVATPVGGVPEAIEDGRTGLLVPPDDAEALARAISTLLDDIELRSRVGQLARCTIEERFALPRVVRRIEDLYRQVAGRATPT
jgi:glycosyltransferase involved in cell wall biosynthesis